MIRSDMITVSAITRYGDHGWTWTVTTVEPDFDADGYVPVSTEYRTDGCGRGLWVWQPSGMVEVDRAGHVTSRVFEWHQVLGFLQLNLNCSPAARRDRVLGLAVGLGEDREGMTWRQVYAARPRVS
jgi:hypothetical protein